MNIKERYTLEILNIKTRLKDLENGRITEFTGANGDGSLATNISNLRKDLNDLFRKINNDLPSELEELDDLFQ